MDEWQKMDFHPDGIYTGFLADAAQADKAVDFIQRFKKKETKVLVDPVMGDDGEEYPIYTEELCEKMRMLVREAAVITPNITEALLLLYGREKMHTEWQKISEFSGEKLLEYLQTIGSLLIEKFDVEAVITGISHEEDGAKYISNLICKKAAQTWVTTKKEGGSYSGTGDLFASILSAGMVRGTDTAASVQKAVNFLAKGIHDAVEEGTDRNEGICFETYLYELADTK